MRSSTTRRGTRAAKVAGDVVGTGVRHAYRAAHRLQNRRAGLVLAYHRVARPTLDPHTLAVDPDRFAEQMKILATEWDVVPLEEMLRESSNRRVAITFDDGYADNALVARPILDEAGIPATIFVTTGTLGSAGMWWDELAQLVLLAAPDNGRVELEVAGSPFTADLHTEEGRQEAHHILHRRLRQQTPTVIDAALRALRAALVPGAPPTDDNRMMTDVDVKDASASPFLTIGAHTCSHPSLAALPADEQLRELSESRAALEAITGNPVRAFAYPFGNASDFDDRTLRAVADAGFDLACTTLPGLVRPSTDPIKLPRRFVGDVGPSLFRHLLTEWFAS